jgi:hypothetical protein
MNRTYHQKKRERTVHVCHPFLNNSVIYNVDTHLEHWVHTSGFSEVHVCHCIVSSGPYNISDILLDLLIKRSSVKTD